jgi:coatomer protein complex subunit alpha (xenin)
MIPQLNHLDTHANYAKQAKKIKAQCERNPQDQIDIDFDSFAEFDICAASFTPIYSGSPSVSDPFTGAKYHPQYKGSVCRISDVTEIGAPASGLRLFVPSQF